MRSQGQLPMPGQTQAVGRFRDLDRVRLIVPVSAVLLGGESSVGLAWPSVELNPGLEGTIVYEYTIPHEAYEVEFPIDPPYVSALATCLPEALSAVDVPPS